MAANAHNRIFVRIVSVADGLVGLCNDGTVWRLQFDYPDAWIALPSAPREPEPDLQRHNTIPNWQR